MSAKLNGQWPVLKTYDQKHLRRIAMPLGGIGTGTISLGGRGNLLDWEVGNKPCKGFTPGGSFFALWTKSAGKIKTLALEGLIPDGDYEGGSGCTASNHGLPRFRFCQFATAYPLAQVSLSDPDIPLDVRIEAFNPLTPPDADDSGIPVAILRYVLINKTGSPVQASVCGSLPSFMFTGHGGIDPEDEKKVVYHNTFRRRNGLQGVFLEPSKMDIWAEAWGTMALTTTAKSGVSYRTAWEKMGWSVPLLDFWDDFSDDGELENREQQDERFPNSSLAVKLTVPPRSEKAVTFMITWHYPNRRAWNKVFPRFKGHYKRNGKTCPDQHVIGNYYTMQYRDAWDAAARTAPRLAELEDGTIKFVRDFCKNDLPEVVKEAALFNASTLRTQTCFRGADGNFFTWEGCSDKSGCCNGSCTHVWNYEQTTAFLFGSLSRSMRKVEFAYGVWPDGMMSFRVNLPLGMPSWKVAAADGQMGCLMKLYRDWKLSGDDAMLKELWPKAKKALAFCWLPGSWDADKDGVMEGCQHNTMDVEYFGPNPEINVWYLGALRAGEELAKQMNDLKFAKTCHDLFIKGSQWMDKHLFNGRYYEHHIVPPKSKKIKKGLQIGSGARDPRSPDFQVGKGCLADQLVGQYMAHICGLGYLLDNRKVRATMKSIMDFNFRKSLIGHFNNMRSYAMNEDQALLLCTYPLGKRPRRPHPYFLEAWTGLEYAAGVGMMQEGLKADGLKVFSAVRGRHAGNNRNPFDEPECGHHYGRAMAAWGAIPTLTGFQYNGVDGEMVFAPASGTGRKDFWSTGNAYGTCVQKKVAGGIEVSIQVGGGKLKLSQVGLFGLGRANLPKKTVMQAGDSQKIVVKKI